MKRMMGLVLSTAVLLSAVTPSADTIKLGAVYALTGAGAVPVVTACEARELAMCGRPQYGRWFEDTAAPR